MASIDKLTESVFVLLDFCDMWLHIVLDFGFYYIVIHKCCIFLV